jgi:nicotinamide mononucleotide adenylyltransferase
MLIEIISKHLDLEMKQIETKKNFNNNPTDIILMSFLELHKSKISIAVLIENVIKNIPSKVARSRSRKKLYKLYNFYVSQNPEFDKKQVSDTDILSWIFEGS